MSQTQPMALPGRGATLKLLIRSVFIESIRRREVSVALLFIGLFAVGAIVSRIVGTESEAAAEFIVNLGMNLAIILALSVSILMAARQFPDELEARSLYPLLAKPVSRGSYVLGKWLATWLTGILIVLVLNGLVLVTCEWPSDFSVLHLAQALLLQVAALGVATAIALVLSIGLPKVLAMVVTFLLVFGAGPLVAILRNAVPDRAVDWATSYIPDFGRLDIVNGLTAGDPALAVTDLAARLIWAAIVSCFTIALAMFLLERKSL